MQSAAPNLTRTQLDFSKSCPGTERTDALRQATQVQRLLASFVGTKSDKTTFISLGENCSTAWYLKQLGLKKASFPFDWVFSSPEIILDCLADRFAAFLDKTQIYASADGKSAGHARYHANLFNHKNPLDSAEDYAYLSRCCQRFLSCAESNQNICYLITLINEPHKRPGWAEGFTHAFAMPERQSPGTVSHLVETLTGLNRNAKFIIIDHYTHSKNNVQGNVIDEHTLSLEFHAGGKSTGVFFPNHFDDFCFKQVLCGLFG
ncbi:DUF1796 family putative cysteine peptidase [Alteromonas halophila]|uniref:Uncharacterized protein n=1 Tax=Alteromonas halophila TaxID=516698 RepID=A0A918JJ33_9ALTE|nr:DUF1796 family putative cysteine peptidase [Alteromonas halophila]GGW83712.1 hypothetical protein GCM10007391_16620 [Alteromonas halophila]